MTFGKGNNIASREPKRARYFRSALVVTDAPVGKYAHENVPLVPRVHTAHVRGLLADATKCLRTRLGGECWRRTLYYYIRRWVRPLAALWYATRHSTSARVRRRFFRGEDASPQRLASNLMRKKGLTRRRARVRHGCRTSTVACALLLWFTAKYGSTGLIRV